MTYELNGEPRVKDEVSVVLVGDSKTGKSSILQQFCQTCFSEDYVPTSGVDFNSRIVQAEGKFVRMHMWDCSGSETFLWAAHKHISQADGFVFVYDVTDERSFLNLQHWFEQIQRFAKNQNLPKILVGNKFS